VPEADRWRNLAGFEAVLRAMMKSA
jgi:hypothetical protein